MGFVALVAVAVDAGAASGASAKPLSYEKQVLPLLEKYCYSCHGGGKKKGDLALDAYKDPASAVSDPKTWEKVMQNLGSHVMPPDNKPQPSATERDLIVRWVETHVFHCDCDHPDPGRVTLRRLNRAEYNNTIHDLVGVDFQPADDFPADDSGYGFDNIGDVLSVPPVLIEKYLAAAEKILDAAIITAEEQKPQTRRFDAAGLDGSAPGEDVDVGARRLGREGDIFVRHKFPRDGEYVLRVSAYGEQAGPEPPKMTLRLGQEDLKTFEVPVTAGNSKVYEVRAKVSAGTNRFAAAYINNFVDRPKKLDRNLVVEWLEISGPIDAAPAPLPESHRRIFFRDPAPSAHPASTANVGQASRLPGRAKRGLGDGKAAPFGAAGQAGRLPYVPDATSTAVLLSSFGPAATGQTEYAREIIRRFATRAFRRPATVAEVNRLARFVELAENQGDSFERGVQLALQAVLVSPHFLFRGELQPDPDNPKSVHPINDYALASRLSYFLWSTMPDDELFALAAKGALRSNLDAQVARMLKHPRSRALVDNFAGQWLQLRNLKIVTPDAKTFPGFDEPLRLAMLRETELFLEHMIREDHSVLDLLDANYTFVDERLARHYGIAGVKGPEFQRVSLRGMPRSGVLTHGSILTLTSNPTRTSPVKRGKYILENILGAPPPPPPPDVPELKETKLEGTLRQRMEQHRANPTCASCHARMDPIGFGFENFDGVGAFRQKEGDFPIDASGALVSGDSFNGASELSRILHKKKREEFARCLSEKMLTYALGRGLEFYDKCALDQITKGLARKNYKFSALVAGIVKSVPFQQRRGELDKAAQTVSAP